MVDKTSKLIGNKVAGGDFEELLHLLEKNPKDLTKKQAIYFIICCCTTCNANINSPAILDQREIIICTKSLAKKVTDVTSEEFDNYLQSVFYICKLLLKKDVMLVLELEHEILPSFVPDTLTDKQKGTYKSICQLIKIEALNTNQRNEKLTPQQIILIGQLISNILIKSSNYAMFTEIIFGFGSYFANFGVDLCDQYKFFLENTEWIKTFDEIHRSQGILHYIKCGMFILMSQIKTGDLTTSKSCFLKIMDVISIDECAHLREILKICQFMFNLSEISVEELSEYKDNMMRFFKMYGGSDCFRNVCKTVALTIHTSSCYRKKSNLNYSASLESHLKFFEILAKLTAFFTYYAKNCEAKCVCSNVKGVPEGVYLLTSILNFFSVYITNHEVTKNSVNEILAYIDKFGRFLIALKKNNCVNYDNYWSELLRYTYNFAVVVYKKEMYEETLSISYTIVKYHSLLGDLDEDEVLPNTMSLLNCTYLKQGKFMEALLWTSVELLNAKRPSWRKGLANIIKVKVAARDSKNNTIQESNVITILDAIPKEYKCYLKNIETNLDLQTELLMAELETYERKWRSKIPMLSTFRHLCKIADNKTLMKVFVEIFSSWEMNIHEDMEPLLETVFRNNTGTKDIAYVNYFRYKMRSQKLITKNIEQMNKTIKAREAPSHPVDVIMGTEANDKCDVVSVYDGLKIDGDKLDLLKQCLKNLDSTTEYSHLDLEKLYIMSKNVAFEFLLHSDIYNFLKAISIGLKLSKILKNHNYVLECTGFILKYTHCNELESSMKKIIRDNEVEIEYLIEYYVNLTYGYLNSNLEEASKYFNRAVKYLNHSEYQTKNWYVEVAVELLTFEILQIDQKDQVYGLSYKPLAKAYGIIVDKYTTEPEWKPKHFALFFEVFETLIRKYHDLKMPREVRCFGKQTLQIAQQHSIPIASTKALNYLAHADYRSGRWDDFRVKLDGISQILCLDNVKKNQIKRTDGEIETVPTINVITEGIRDVNIDDDGIYDLNTRILSSSPTFIGESYREPDFANHERCDCFKCTSTEYHRLVVGRYHLEALWYFHLKKVTLANSFFKGTLNFARTIAKKPAVVPKDLNKTALLNNCSISRWYYSCSVDYVKFLYACATPDAAQKHIQDLLNSIVSQKKYHVQLYGEILLQKLKFLHRIKRPEPELLTVPLPESACKTPEAVRKIVKLSKSPKLKTGSLYPPKIIKFNLDEENNKQTTSITEKTPKSKVLPPGLRAAKTPLLKTPSAKTERLPLVELASDKKTDVKLKDSLMDLKSEKLRVKTRSVSTRKKLDLNTARIEDDRNKRSTRRNRT